MATSGSRGSPTPRCSFARRQSSRPDLLSLPDASLRGVASSHPMRGTQGSGGCIASAPSSERCRWPRARSGRAALRPPSGPGCRTLRTRWTCRRADPGSGHLRCIHGARLYPRCTHARRALGSRGQNPQNCRAFSKPTPGLEPGTPSLRDIPNEEVGDHERPSEGANGLQMRLFDPERLDLP